MPFSEIKIRKGLGCKDVDSKQYQSLGSIKQCFPTFSSPRTRRDCRNGSTTASSSATNRRYREYRTDPKLRRRPHVLSPIGSSVSRDEFKYSTFRDSRRDRNYSFKDRNDLSRYHGSTNFAAHQNEGYVTLTPVELYIGIKPSIRHLRPFGSILYVGTPRRLRGKLDPKAKKGILKPQQSNSGAVLASPGLKFSDYEVVENCEDDKTVNNIPVSLPQNSDSETEVEESSRTDSSCKNYMETRSGSTT
ncbi:hypothetical protein TNCV_2250221 [Trichonephila clavipes]|nr:hypothetical protein TNCV_2250221 [Trichonephila clavipes]